MKSLIPSSIKKNEVMGNSKVQIKKSDINHEKEVIVAQQILSNMRSVYPINGFNSKKQVLNDSEKINKNINISTNDKNNKEIENLKAYTSLLYNSNNHYINDFEMHDNTIQKNNPKASHKENIEFI